jgi:hypothetical protein
VVLHITKPQLSIEIRPHHLAQALVNHPRHPRAGNKIPPHQRDYNDAEYDPPASSSFGHDEFLP